MQTSSRHWSERGRVWKAGIELQHLHFPKPWALTATEAHTESGFRANPEEASYRLPELGTKEVVSEAT